MRSPIFWRTERGAWMRGVMIAALLAFAIPAIAVAQAGPPTSNETVLAVSATGSVTAVPDIATITVGVTSSRPASTAASRENAEQAQRLIDALHTIRVPDHAIRTTGVTLEAEHGRDKDGDPTDRITGYRASNRLSVRLTDVERTSAVIDALVEAGATDLQGPVFGFADDTPLLARARIDAVRRARIQAEDYARALGLNIARVIRVSERSSADQSDGANDIIVTGTRRSTPVRPGEQRIQVTVWIDYALAPK